MQYQIRDPQGFAKMLVSLIEEDYLPNLPFLKGFDRNGDKIWTDT